MFKNEKKVKFKAWNKNTQKLLPVQSLQLPNIIVIAGDSSESWNENDTELLQFTGFTDKQGNEIFEGDIVKYFIGWMKEDEENKISGIDNIKVVSFLNGAYIVSTHGDGLMWNYLSNIAKDIFRIEIIGNIFQHSHLLSTEEPLTMAANK